MMNDDLTLLRHYARDHSDEAFAQLVQRYCNLVWSAAYRVLGDASLAQDAAQTAFTDLARKAAQLPKQTILAGWLYRASWLAASKIARHESRRAQREEQAMQIQQQSEPGPDEARAAQQLQPLLDSALADLDEADRNAVVLRFLAGRSLAEVGAALGSNEDAAQKRVARALEKLRGSFRARGVEVSGGLILAALSAAGAQVAPLGLPALLSGTALAGAAVTPTITALLLMKAKVILGTAVVATMATVMVIQHNSMNRLTADNASLRQQLAAPPPPPAAPAVDPDELNRRKAEHDELVRLRGDHQELVRLRDQIAQAAKLTNRPAAPRVELNQAETETAIAEAQQTRMVNSLKIIGVAGRIYANNTHQDFAPTNFVQLMNYGIANLDAKASVDNFELITYSAPVSFTSPEVILAREKMPRQWPDGTWHRAYLLVDGSVQVRSSPTSDFSAIEQPTANGLVLYYPPQQ